MTCRKDRGIFDPIAFGGEKNTLNKPRHQRMIPNMLHRGAINGASWSGLGAYKVRRDAAQRHQVVGERCETSTYCEPASLKYNAWEYIGIIYE